jgi:hypothetical protein
MMMINYRTNKQVKSETSGTIGTFINTKSIKQPICLVLACNRPFYNDRRNKNKDVWERLTNSGFRVMFLFADPTLTKPQFGTDTISGTGSEYSTLTVPCPEVYEYLTQKIQLAYSVLAGTCSGILKMDDNTRINDPSCLIELQKIIQTYDYFGSNINHKKQGEIEKIQYKCKFSPLFNKLIAMFDKSFSYFGGPFYWVSDNVLQEIAKNKRALEYPWEDLSVGYFISKFPHLKTLFLPWNSEKRITWDTLTEIE